MALELACADFTFPLLDHDRALDLIALLEFPAVDIGLFEGRSHLWPSTEFVQLEKNAKQLARKLSDRGLQPADIFLQTAPEFVSLAPNHPDRSRRQEARVLFLKTLDYAAGCGSRHVSALPGVLFPEESPADSLARACEELAWRCAEAAKRDLIFAVEAHVGSLAPTPRAALELVEQTPGLTLTLDYTHFTRAGIPDADVEPLLAHASHFHTRGAREGRLQAAFKDNTIDYGRIWQVMKSTGYRGHIGIEYVWIDWEHCNEVDNLSETILFRDFFRALATTV